MKGMIKVPDYKLRDRATGLVRRLGEQGPGLRKLRLHAAATYRKGLATLPEPSLHGPAYLKVIEGMERRAERDCEGTWGDLQKAVDDLPGEGELEDSGSPEVRLRCLLKMAPLRDDGERSKGLLACECEHCATSWAYQEQVLLDLLGKREEEALLPGVAQPVPREIRAMAEAAYQERPAPPSGELDAFRLGLLADALEEDGWVGEVCDCLNERCPPGQRKPLLAHLRGPGPHVRGCWALDAVSGRA